MENDGSDNLHPDDASVEDGQTVRPDADRSMANGEPPAPDAEVSAAPAADAPPHADGGEATEPQASAPAPSSPPATDRTGGAAVMDPSAAAQLSDEDLTELLARRKRKPRRRDEDDDFTPVPNAGPATAEGVDPLLAFAAHADERLTADESGWQELPPAPTMEAPAVPAPAAPPAALTEAAPASAPAPAPVAPTAPAAVVVRRSSPLLWLVAVNSTVMLGVLGYLLLHPLAVTTGMAPAPAAPAAPAAAATSQPAPEADPLVLALANPVAATANWPDAERAFQDGNMQAAFPLYRSLFRFARSKGDTLVAEYLLLRTADCMRRLEAQEKATEVYQNLTTAASPIVRAVANTRLAQEDLEGGRFLEARSRCYAALGAMGFVDPDGRLALDCRYLICRSLTEACLRFHDGQWSAHWTAPRLVDPFAGLNEDALRALLGRGAEENAAATLQPRILRIPGSSQWQVLAAAAPLEDVLNRCGGTAGLDVQWGELGEPVRTRRVTLGVPSVTMPELTELACGAVGLVAVFGGDSIRVEDPQGQGTTGRQREVLTREATAAWRRFLLRWGDDARAGEGHLAMSLLYELSGDDSMALKEYQVVSHRYEDIEVASRALAGSARIRMRLRDFRGARVDLLELLDTNPRMEGSGENLLDLARVTRAVGLHEDAATLYRRVYFLNASDPIRAEAALELGRCLSETDRHDEARLWFERYLGHTGSTTPTGLAEAHLALGKGLLATGDPAKAAESCYHGLGQRPDGALRTELLLTLADAQARRGHYVRALVALDELPLASRTDRQLSAASVTEDHRFRWYLLRARMLRSVNLPLQAVDLLEPALRDVEDKTLIARLRAELGRALRDGGELDEARTTLRDALLHLPDGREAWEASCDLAEVLLRMRRSEEAAAALQSLMRGDLPDDLHERAKRLLTQTYLRKEQLHRAAELLLSDAAPAPVAPDAALADRGEP